MFPLSNVQHWSQGRHRLQMPRMIIVKCMGEPLACTHVTGDGRILYGTSMRQIHIAPLNRLRMLTQSGKRLINQLLSRPPFYALRWSPKLKLCTGLLEASKP